MAKYAVEYEELWPYFELDDSGEHRPAEELIEIPDEIALPYLAAKEEFLTCLFLMRSHIDKERLK